MSKFGEIVHIYMPLIKRVLLSAETKYVFTSSDYFQFLVKNSLSEANKVYVYEILCHLHAASMVTLRRNLSWIESIENSERGHNYFGFCSSLRGFLESAADSFYSLRYAPKTLAAHSKEIRFCIQGKQSKKAFMAKELENLGIHFMEAGKYGDKSLAEEHYKAKSAWEYFKAIDSDNVLQPIYLLYQKLCQITHPSRDTTYLYFRQINENAWGACDCDQKLEIHNIISNYEKEYEDIFQKCFNSAIILLWIIDQFSIEGLRCPQMRMIDFSNIAEFNKLKKMIMP